jgi:hypothetical protein
MQFVFMSGVVVAIHKRSPSLPPPCTSPHLRKKQKVSKNTGDWNTLSPATQLRYSKDVPSPDPIIQSFKAASTSGQKLEFDFNLITQQVGHLEPFTSK